MLNKNNYFIGLMSGTSLDGVDAVLTQFHSKQAELIASHSQPIPSILQSTLKEVLHPSWTGSLERIGTLHQELGILFSNAVIELLNKSSVKPNQIKAIGSHGQTLWHQPQSKYPFSLQLGDANLIAEKTGITTIADFRSRDIAAGGQGAPLVPAFHKATLTHSHIDRIILNIGGIANISILPSLKNNQDVLGFDTGPGNGLLDAWILQNKNKPFDTNGSWGESGHILNDVLELLLQDPYFSLPYPKSTGKEAFNLIWLNKKLEGKLDNHKPQDIQATLTELTARSIAQHINFTSLKSYKELYVCGGGIHNRFLMKRLLRHLPEIKTDSTQKLGIDPDWMEAIAFSWLAKQTLEGKAGNLPAVTGAKGLRVLGAIYPANKL